jgi:hypothetical protein
MRNFFTKLTNSLGEIFPIFLYLFVEDILPQARIMLKLVEAILGTSPPIKVFRVITLCISTSMAQKANFHP